MILVRVHDGEQPAAHRPEAFPCIIGRSMHCAIRVDDPSVSARHAEIVAEGDAFVLRDLGSTNGIARGGVRVQEIRLVSNETVYLGDVRLDLVVEEELQPTRQNRLIPEEPEADSRATTPKAVLTLVVAYAYTVAMQAADEYGQAWPPEKPAQIFGRALILWLALVGVATAVSLFCKLNVKRFHFHRVLAVLATAAVSARAFELVAPTLVFNLHNLRNAAWLMDAGYAAIVFWMCFFLQRYAFRRWPARRRAGVAAAIAAVVVALAIFNLQRSVGPGDRDRMSELGLPLRSLAHLGRTTDDLTFDLSLAIVDVDEARIRALELLEAERDGTE